MPRTKSNLTVKALRAEAKAAYARGKGNRALKGYSKMSKHALLQALGRSEEAKVELKRSRSVTSTKTASAVAAHLEGDSATRKAQIKGRLLRAVKREITKARKVKANISQDELRAVAGRAFANEVKAIRKGLAEVKPKRGGTKTKQTKSSGSKLDNLLRDKVYNRGVGNEEIFESQEALKGESVDTKKEDWATSTAVLKRRYRRLSQIYHPDSGGSEEQMRNLTHAYENAKVFPELHEKFEKQKAERAAKKRAAKERTVKRST